MPQKAQKTTKQCRNNAVLLCLLWLPAATATELRGEFQGSGLDDLAK